MVTLSEQPVYLSPKVRIVTRPDGSGCACAGCDKILAEPGAPWKEGAIRREVSLADAGGPAYETGDEDVVLRHFYCPDCGALLDTETAMAADPTLRDRVRQAG